MPAITRLLTSGHIRALCLLGLLCIAPTVTSAVECSEIQYRAVRSTICQVDIRSDHLRLYLSDESGTPFNSFQRLADSLVGRGEQLLFAMNAGMYREDYSPVGLMIREGRQVHRLNLATGYGNFYLKPNGVFVLSASGARLLESSQYRTLQEPVIFATQSGPLLLQAGQINAALSPQGTSRLIRNGVGVMSADRVVFAISEDPISFYEFALLFRDRLNCADALYLDGNVSSLYSKALKRNDNRVPLGPLIAVTASRSR
jgi:uncharacterized protein YigE (DUF2233 family)